MPDIVQPIQIEGRQVVLRADPSREYVTAGRRLSLTRGIRALPWAIDDLSTDFGDDIYERMLLDAQIVACVNIFKASILEDGIHLVPAVLDEAELEHARAAEIATFCQDILNDLDPSIDDTMWDMLDAVALGNRVAEEVWALRDGQLVLRALKVKPRRSVSFVVDEFMNVLGLVPGGTGGIAGKTVLLANGETGGILPRDKFAVLTFRPRNGDPRGTTLLRPVYTPWWLKQQSHPEHLKFLAQFASPSVVATLAEHAQGGFAQDASGADIPGTYKTAAQWLLESLLEFRNSSAMVVPYGTEVQLVEAAKGGDAFTSGQELWNREIAKGILHQTLATEEAEHGTRAQATVHQDVLGIILRQARKAVERMIRRDILLDLVRYNYGDDAAHLTPAATLGEVEQQDVTNLMNAIANLERAGYIADEQRPAIDVQIGFPPRSVMAPPSGDSAPAAPGASNP